jgi:hypothetical protein
MQVGRELTYNRFSLLKSLILIIKISSKVHMLPCRLVYHLLGNVMEKLLKLSFKHSCREPLKNLNS